MRIEYVDSHTAGEPTRVVTGGFPGLDGSEMEGFVATFRARDELRRGIVLEPRGSAILVGALLTPPCSEGAAAGVIFFNNVGLLGMCGHGTIGAIETLRWLGRLAPGPWKLDTPVGTVAGTLHESGEVQLDNVPSYAYREAVHLEVPGVGSVEGQVAYGGNWFFLVESPSFTVTPSEIPNLTQAAVAIRRSLERAGITGENGALIDHIELFGPSDGPGISSRNFVLCPGLEFDRSPCGTGTSAKVACLIQNGKLAEGEVWVQESVTGGVFRAWGRREGDRIRPTLVGRAHVVGQGTLHFHEDDPYRWGLITG